MYDQSNRTDGLSCDEEEFDPITSSHISKVDIRPDSPTKSSNVETGSQIARSIISNIFKGIDAGPDGSVTVNENLREVDEVEMHMGGGDTSAYGLDQDTDDDMSAVDIVNLTSASICTGGIGGMPVPQSPTTRARISDWIAGLQSNAGTPVQMLPVGEGNSSTVAQLRPSRFSEQLAGAERQTGSTPSLSDQKQQRKKEDDQPPGYIKPISEPSPPSVAAKYHQLDKQWKIKISCHSTPTLPVLPPVKLTSPSKAVKSLPLLFDSCSDESQHQDDAIVNGNDGTDMITVRNRIHDVSDSGENRYVKIIETTNQVVKCDKNGVQILDAERTVERSETCSDAYEEQGPFITKTRLIFFLLVALVMIGLSVFGPLPLYQLCGYELVIITNQTLVSIIEGMKKI